MCPKTIAFLAILAMLSLASAVDYLPLDNETAYCERYGISFWCTKEGVEFLQGLSPEDLNDFTYINDLAFSDSVRYTGDLKIRSIDVSVDITSDAKVEAVYDIQNGGGEDAYVKIITLETQPGATEVYLDGDLQDVDSLLAGLYVTFAPDEERELKLVFTEPSVGDIFGYNVNLLFDDKTIDNHVTPLGTFAFKLPLGKTVKQCLPTGYTTKTEGGRTVVTWSKRDFIPWTNPFNDLICTWTTGAAQPVETPAQGGDNTMVWIILVILILGGVFWLYRSGRLEDLLNR